MCAQVELGTALLLKLNSTVYALSEIVGEIGPQWMQLFVNEFLQLEKVLGNENKPKTASEVIPRKSFFPKVDLK